VGVSGLPSDPAFLRAILEHDGADYDKVRQVTIGFSAVSRILSRRVAAVPAFWNAEGVALRRRGLKVAEFRVEDYGAPRYPEVVFITARKTLRRHRDRLVRALAAIEAGRRDVLAHPAPAVRQIATAAETRDTGLIDAQLRAVRSAFAPGLRLGRGILDQCGRSSTPGSGSSIVDRRPDVERAFDLTLAP
jgi:putative hydroxymethylpyrimidine transport system substrate-binding protein